MTSNSSPHSSPEPPESIDDQIKFLPADSAVVTVDVTPAT
jgi:hypothetical protein